MKDKKGEFYDWLNQNGFVLIDRVIYQSISSEKWNKIPVQGRYSGSEWVSDGHLIVWINLDDYKHLSDDKKKDKDGEVEHWNVYIPEEITTPVQKLDPFKLNFFNFAFEDNPLFHIYVPTDRMAVIEGQIQNIFGEIKDLPAPK